MEDENKILRAMFPYLSKSTNSFCFRFVYGLLVLGMLALVVKSVLTGQVLFFELALALGAAGLAGQLFPLFPVGIVNFFMLFGFVVMTLNGYWTAPEKPYTPASVQVKVPTK